VCLSFSLSFARSFKCEALPLIKIIHSFMFRVYIV
jgi:hypothetical protein